ncbi:MAG: DUF2007 domain-containing protein [Bacteroidetes bacterium]|nr:DUF2007 domain-containing protein [Bacteroidota bacterium]MBL0065816.1 DUF2007 domain-containing protein [Bacteroidota bacterium]
MENGWECIYSSDKMHLAEIVQAVLRDEGIESVAVDKRDSSYITIGEVELYVPGENAILARSIIEQHQL